MPCLADIHASLYIRHDVDVILCNHTCLYLGEMIALQRVVCPNPPPTGLDKRHLERLGRTEAFFLWTMTWQGSEVT